MIEETKNLKYFLYARRSSETEDRQVASVASQISELKKMARQENLKIADVFQESKSAKAPGRPIFNEMFERISRGEADAILCWKLDRLARNPIDGGSVSWLLQQNIIKHIKTHDRSYYPTDNVLMMAVELGMANQFVRDLSNNVKRGLRNKVEAGWLPGEAPLGYMNTPDRTKGHKIVVPNPDLWPIIQKMWEKMLTGVYTPPQILKLANEQWGLRTSRRGKKGGSPLSRSGIYKMFTNPFYMGRFQYAGKWYKGAHKAMVTAEEFERAQMLLGSKGKPSLRKREFAFTGTIKCGECGGQITAEYKQHCVCANCKHKFSCVHNKVCPACKTDIGDMLNPVIRTYTLYRCTKNKIGKTCRQPSVNTANLEQQIEKYISQIELDPDYFRWAIKHLRKAHKIESKSQMSIRQSQQRAYDLACQKLDKLMDLLLLDQISQQDYARKKEVLENERDKYGALMKGVQERQSSWLEQAERTFEFARYARERFKEAREKGDFKRQRAMLKTIGLNLTLKDKILRLEAQEPFALIHKALQEVPEAAAMFEPAKSPRIVRGKAKREKARQPNPQWFRDRDSNPSFQIQSLASCR